ncbi:MAG: diacylglycerol kinase family protein [Firmicutes bacterium]|nr:diacylglycerol kinase family protein [Bacillota bacterium]
MKNRSWPESFGNALNGIRKTVSNERNFRIQLVFGIIAIIGCIIFRVEAWQFMLVTSAIFFVLTMELVNTAIEALTDLSCKGKIHPLAKTAKDAAAGAVLLASGFAVVAGIVVAVSVIRNLLA